LGAAGEPAALPGAALPGAALPGSSSFIEGAGAAGSPSALALGAPTVGSLGQASPRRLVIDTAVVSSATHITHAPRPTMSSALSPTMNNVKRSWYRLLIKRFFQLRL